MKKIISIIFLFCTLFLPVFLYAQEDLSKASVELKKLAERYTAPAGLSFEIEYKYADAEKPGQWLDSLKGKYKIRGKEYWYVLDNTETMGNLDYTIILFKEDKIMYLSKPSPASMKTNPLSLVDSFIFKKIQKAEIEIGGSQKKISLSFRPGSIYKKIDYYINVSSGLIDKIVQIVSSDQLYESSVRSLVGPSYAIVEIAFQHYARNTAEDDFFRTDHYFKREGASFLTVTPYESYKIFLGSPDL